MGIVSKEILEKELNKYKKGIITEEDIRHIVELYVHENNPLDKEKLNGVDNPQISWNHSYNNLVVYSIPFECINGEELLSMPYEEVIGKQFTLYSKENIRIDIEIERVNDKYGISYEGKGCIHDIFKTDDNCENDMITVCTDKDGSIFRAYYYESIFSSGFMAYKSPRWKEYYRICDEHSKMVKEKADEIIKNSLK